MQHDGLLIFFIFYILFNAIMGIMFVIGGESKRRLIGFGFDREILLWSWV